MADKPIIFSKAMVLALLADRKTQTRRLARRIISQRAQAGDFGIHMQDLGAPDLRGKSLYFRPAYAVGDRLYVREAWRTFAALDNIPPTNIWRADPEALIRYEASPFINDVEGWGKMRPGIHMPKRASRITLTVTDVRLQKLQEIDEDDAQAEGMGEPYLGDGDPPFTEQAVMISRRMQFRNLWHALHGPDAWAQNPHVFAYSFTVEKRNIDGAAP